MSANAEETARLVTNLSASQRRRRHRQQQRASHVPKPIPKAAAAGINDFVGKNILGTGEELRGIMAKNREKRWLEFFRDKLVPEAEKGLDTATFTGLPDEDLDGWRVCLMMCSKVWPQPTASDTTSTWTLTPRVGRRSSLGPTHES
uniref:Uncharacterized protein n=1 Tax=Zooxanthella nutricula TaxID=1333877 RepID=A0A6U9L533_9DINO